MPLLRITAGPQGLHLHGCAEPAAAALKARRGNGPVIVMVHGYKYAPGSTRNCPHARIFAADAAGGWPRALGFDGAEEDEGLCIAFGWHARGSLARICRQARATGAALAEMILTLRIGNPGRQVHVIAHSLGSEIALSALACLPAGAVGRMILLTGASYGGHARRMLATPAGQRAEVLNVVSRENDLFDLAFERLVRPAAPGDRALGAGLEAPNVLNLQIDCARSLAALGLPALRGRRRFCHWSAYTRPGLMGFYAEAMRDPGGLSLAALRGMLPQGTEARWSRLRPAPPSAAPFRGLASRVKRRIMAVHRAGDRPDEHAY